eukprot:gene14305-19187_t
MPKQEHREYLRKVLGYNLTTNTEGRVFFIYYGFGSNGKTLISKILKENYFRYKQYTQVDSSIFIKKKSNAGQATPELMSLLNCRCGVYSEGETSDNIEMNTAGLKQISGWRRCINGKKIIWRPYNIYAIY